MNNDSQQPRAMELERLQQWMQAVITHPSGVAAGVAADAAQHALDEPLELWAEIIAPAPRLSGAGRLAIYNRAYHARLLQCLAAMFPCLRRALGADLFNRFALDYLQHHPPQSYTLNALADRFAQYLAATRPQAGASPEERESWPDFIIELAQFEGAFLQVYDGPGLEDRPALPVRVIAALPDTRLLALRPVPAPCLRLFVFRYPVHIYWRAARHGGAPPLPAPAASWVALTRQDYGVRVYQLTATQHALLRVLDGRRTLAQALATGVGCPLPAVNLIRDWLCDWTGKGFWADFTPTDEQQVL